MVRAVSRSNPPAGSALQSALGFAACYWPGPQRLALVGADQRGDESIGGGLPEDGATVLRNPVVLAIWEQEL